MERYFEAKHAGVIIVRPDRFEFTEPEGYPALYCAEIDYGDGRRQIGDFILVRDRNEYEELFERMERLYREISEREETGKSLSEVIGRLDDLKTDLELTIAAKEYTTIVDDEDYEILKAGWQLGVKRYDKESRIAGIVGYETWPEYSGIDPATSAEINAYLWDMAFKKRKFDLKELVKDLSKKFKLDKDQAELIVRTEMANIFNKMREWAYKEKTDVTKFVWVAKKDACDKCLAIAKASKRGVTLDELKELIKMHGGPYAREWTVHPNCRCTFVRKYGKKARWE